MCGKPLKALLPILLPALERNGHLKLDDQIRPKILSMSAATLDRLLRVPKRAMQKKRAPRAVPEPRRRIKMRTFAKWDEPPPGSMEMDVLVYRSSCKPWMSTTARNLWTTDSSSTA